MDHRRMNLISCRQFRNSALALHGLHRHPRLERRVMVPASVWLWVSMKLAMAV
jgi:hypothetical protein